MKFSKIETMMNLMDNLSDPVTKKHIAHAMKRELNRVICDALNTTPGPNDHDRLTAEEIGEMRDGRRISAIKMVRTRTGLGLRESKQLVEWAYEPTQYPRPDHLR